VQAALQDAMGLGPEAVVVLHVGGSAGGRAAAADRFLTGFEMLGERARARLVLENDDRLFGVGGALAVAERAGVPLVFDVLHHHCHDPEGIDDRQALELALATWPAGVTPKVHFSSPRLDVGERRRHADLIDPIAFEQFVRHTAAGLDLDVMLEAKAKDLALLRLRDQLAARGVRFESWPPLTVP
jgi:UV DNA damage endonuclease